MTKKNDICVNDTCIIKQISGSDFYSLYLEMLVNKRVRVKEIESRSGDFVTGSFKLLEEIPGFMPEKSIISFDRGVELELAK